MKKSQIKSIFILVMILLLSLFAVFALEGVILTYPLNVWVTSNTVNFNFTPNSSVNTVSYCAVYANNSGVMALKANYTGIANGTAHVAGISINNSNGANPNVYGWNVTCSNGTSNFGADILGTFGVDANIPSVTQDSPANGAYIQNLSNTMFKYTPTDTTNPDSCMFFTNLSGVWQNNITNNSYTSGTQVTVNLSVRANNHTSVNIPDGKYVWAVYCNDSAANSIFSQNRSFIIDTVAPTAPSFSVPAKLNQTNATLRVEWSVSTELNFDRYDAVLSPYSNMSDPTQVISVSGNTSKNATTFVAVEDGSYFVRINSHDLAGWSANSTSRNYLLDTVVLNVTLNSPAANNSYSSDNTPDFNFTVLDANPDSCDLLLSTFSSSTLLVNSTRIAVANGTQLNLTPLAMADGVYQFNIECNDTVNHRKNASAVPWQITIDTTLPTAPYIISTFHQTNSTNIVPTLLWGSSLEVNFSRYLVQASYANNNSVAYETNITSISVNYSRLNLSRGYAYTFNVTTYDRAGNTNSSGNTTLQTRYYVDSVCGLLTAGWNICGAVWTQGKSLSLIANETGANQIAVFNQSHAFATCNAAVSTTGQHCNNNVNISSIARYDLNGSYDTSINHGVFVYVNTSTNWNNRTWAATKLTANATLTNASGVRWNLVAGFVRGGSVFGHLKNRFDVNVSMMSLPLNNGTKIPYINNGLFRSINNATSVDYGRAFWVFYNLTNQSNETNTHALANSTYDVSLW